MRTIFSTLAILLTLVGVIVALAVLLLPLYYTIKKDEPLYLLLFFISPIAAGIVAQVFILIGKSFMDDY